MTMVSGITPLARPVYGQGVERNAGCRSRGGAWADRDETHDWGRGGMGRWPGMSLFPPGPWPDLYKYSENASPGMNEGVTSNMAATAFAYAIFVRGE